MASKAYAQAGGRDEPDWSLVEAYLPLVKSIVGRMRIYFPPQAEMDDIYSVGVSGLITAIRRSDPDKIDSFASYAALRIKGAILDELRRLDWMPRASRMQAKKFRTLVGELEQKLGRPATDEEVRAELQVSKAEYARILDQVRPITLISMDQSGSDDNDRGSIHEVVADETEMDARETCEKRETVTLMRERIKQLPEVPQKVLMMYYFENMRLAEIAEVFGLTESRICQIHSQAVLSLRTYLDRVTQK